MYTTILQPDKKEWDAFVRQHTQAHFLQSYDWGQLKANFGWDAQPIALKNHQGEIIAGAQILYRPLPYRLGRLAYIPFGPLVDWSNNSLVQALFKAIDRAAQRRRVAFLKIEPGYDLDLNHLQSNKFRLSPQTIQPPSTIVLDIAGSDKDQQSIDEDYILRRMNQGTRRNIRKSQKSEIVIREATFEDVASFNQLLAETAARNQFGVHTSTYYERMYNYFVKGDSPVKGVILLASYKDATTAERKDLAGVFILQLEQWAWYVAGASTEEERERRASFGVQWAAIEWARRHGVRHYDLYGIPDVSEAQLEAEFEQRQDGLWGVYRFKRGWGGRIVRTVGAWDRVYNPLIYWAYRTYLFLRGSSET